MKKQLLLLGVMALLGAGCVNINVDIDANADIPPVIDFTVDGDDDGIVAESENIRVFSPADGSGVSGSSFTVTGEARTFENVVSWRVTDIIEGGSAEGSVTADAPDIGQFGPFSIEVPNVGFDSTLLRVEIFQYSARDGAEIDMVTIEVGTDGGGIE